jgi:DNA polymerase III subunit delta
MVVVLTGNNSFSLQEYLQNTVIKFREKSGDSIERFDGSELTNADSVIDAVRSVSFLEPRKLVIVHDFAQNKDILEKIESLIEQTADSTDLILIDQKLDKRTAAYKYLNKNCDVKVFDEMKPYDLERWLLAEVKSSGIDMTSNDVRFLIDRVGFNQQLLKSELTKLSLSDRQINIELIEEMVEPTPQSKVFDMLEALFSGSAAKAQELYKDQRAQGEEPQKILGMITWQLQQMTLAVFAPEKSVSTLTNAGMSPYVAEKTLRLTSQITPDDMRFYITELAEIDHVSKTSADIESALAVYFAEVSYRQSS